MHAETYTEPHIRRDHEAVLLTAGPREPAVNNSVLSEAAQCVFVEDCCGVIVVQLQVNI